MSDTWQKDPDSGGVKINDKVKHQTQKRILKYADANLSGRYKKLDIRFRDKFCYVDAYTEPDVTEKWPTDFPETREEHIERMRNTPIHLFRLRYYGDEDEWGLAFYSYAHNNYETSVFPNRAFFGTPELALETYAGFHL
ncbi:hypothetical protein [Desulfobacula phenolica]|uniref:Uncharacterized protein n=1 Tax=Desulfobacula phenolica TaxID=90732 RepID=A0A1H2IZK4_9BACT|nr:hypothetical protein [Desulfobacula phenolica]SDU49401.1 hypothetical protein SAMN04487931_11028 [Desulfobacula phenolica]